ncbi:MAG: translation initiation factor IF-2 [Spirochaetaceae bacterium]
MAEEKDQTQKKKSTLIKHKKTPQSDVSSEEGAETKQDAKQETRQDQKKKVRVVVRRKTSKPEKEAQPESGAEERGGGSEGAAPEAAGTQPEDRRPEGRQPEGPGREQQKGPQQPARRRPQQDEPRAGYSVREEAKKRREQERTEQQRQAEQRPRAGSGGAGGSGEAARRGPGEQARGRGPTAPRPGAPSDRKPPAGRPGGRPPTAPEGGAPPSKPSEDKRPSHKKFYKTKKKEQYPKRERRPERDFQYKQKRRVPKASAVPKEIDIMEVVTVSELARKMNLKASDLISKLMSMGMMVTINQQIDAETAELLASEYGCKVNIVSLYDETVIESEKDSEERLRSRPPVVTIMGHVDHGKTKLLDAIRTTDVVGGEFGGITQHIGAYQVTIENGKITFLDTPGHEAFTLMRARGAQITDIVVLVVAADDGVMPQTREAIDHAKEAGVPIIVAVNKVDLPDANVDRVKQQLSDLELMPEEWGGNTLFVEVSALKREGIDSLLETVLLQAEVLELSADYDVKAEGTIIESRIDPGRGTIATVLVQRGTLQVGDNFVSGIYPGRIRAMFDDRGEKVDRAEPSSPVEILGLTGVPKAGDPFQVTESEKVARQVGDKRQELRKVEEAKNVRKVTLDNLYDSIQEGEVQELKVVIKGDVHGSVEAVQTALEKLSTPAVRLSVIHAAAGAINESDVMLASASNAIIVGFHVRPTPRATELAEHEKVEIRKYNVIYDVVDDIKAAMEGLLAPSEEEETLGTAEVREVFRVPKIGAVAGCYVTSGKVRRNAQVHVVRDGIQIYTGKVSSLKRFKNDAREVEAGYECGIGVENYNDVKVGDQLEVFEIKKVAKKLEEVQQSQSAE